MPIEFRYNREMDILFFEMRSPLTVDEFESALISITQSADFSPGSRTLWDLRQLDFTETTRSFEERLIAIRKRFPNRGRACIAMLVESDLGYGMSRMYQMLSDDMPQQIKVFRDYSDSVDWLRKCTRNTNESK